MSQEFQREARYAVFKFSKLNEPQSKILQEAMCKLPRVAECLVIEGDWPEYEPVWQMIEARMTAAPVPPAGLICDEVAPITEQAWRSLDSQPAGEVEVPTNKQIRAKRYAEDQAFHSWAFNKQGAAIGRMNGQVAGLEAWHARGEIADAEVTSLTAENARLQGEIEAARDLFETKRRVNRKLRAKRDALQSELTKARELTSELRTSHKLGVVVDEKVLYRLERLLANQSAPAAKD